MLSKGMGAAEPSQLHDWNALANSPQGAELTKDLVGRSQVAAKIPTPAVQAPSPVIQPITDLGPTVRGLADVTKVSKELAFQRDFPGGLDLIT